MANNLTVNINAKNNTKGAFNEVKQSVSSVADATKQRLDDLSRRFERINNSGKPLKRQMREIKDLMAQMNLEGLDKSDVFLRMAQRAGEVKDAIGDAGDAMKRFADDDFNITAATQALSALAGAGSIATSAMALFGTENENVQQAILKVQGALGLLNGVQAVATALNKDSALTMKVRSMWATISAAATTADTAATGANTIATAANTVAMKAWNVAKAIGKALLGDFTGLVIVGAGALAAYAIAQGNSTKATKEGSQALSEEGREEKAVSDAMRSGIAKSVTDLIGKYRMLQAGWNACRTTHEQRQFIEDNASAFKELGFKINSVNDAYDYFVKNSTKVIDAMIAIAKAEGTKEALKKLYEQDSNDLGLIEDYNEGAHKGAAERFKKKYGVSDADAYKITEGTMSKGPGATAARNRIKARRNKEEALETVYGNQERDSLRKQSRAGISSGGGSTTRSTPRRRSTPSRARNTGTTRNTPTTPKNTPVVPNSEEWYDQQISNLEKKRKATPYDNTELLTKIDKEIEKLKEEKDLYEFIARARQNPSNPADLNKLGTIGTPGIAPPKGGASKVDEMNQKKEEAAQLTQDAFSTFGSSEMNDMVNVISQLNDLFESGADGSVKMGAGIAALGQSLQALGQNSAAAKAGLVLGAIGQIILGFAQATAKDSRLGVFGWIAAIAAGLAVMTATISQLQSYATGGIIEGGSRVGDQQLARVNAGEMIINGSQQRQLWDAISNNRLGGGATVVTGDVRVKGSDLWLALSNYDNKMGRVR